MTDRKGFTLIELLIVVVIIGILAAIAIPKFANTKEKAVVASMKSDLRNLVTAQESFFTDNQDYAGGTDPATQSNGKAGAGKVAFGAVGGQRARGQVRQRGRLVGHRDQPGGEEHHQRRVRHLRGYRRRAGRFAHDRGRAGLLLSDGR